MDEIKAPQIGKQLDADLKVILDILEAAPDHDGQVLYIRHNKVDFGNGEQLFDIVPL